MKKRVVILLALVFSLLCSRALGAIIEGEWKDLMMSDLNLKPLKYEYVDLEEKQKATIYSGPGERYAVLAENVELSRMSLAGMVGGWAMIDSDYGVGYVNTGSWLNKPKAEQLRFAYITINAPRDCCLRKYQYSYGGYLAIIREGEELVLLAEMNGAVYAEAKVDGVPVRGFLTRDDYHEDEWKGELSTAGYFTGYDVDLRELYTHQYAVHKEGSVAAGWGFTVGLRSDGTCISRGRNDFGQCDVEDWKNIVAVCAGGDHTVGLRSDGTVVATGDNRYGQCEVGNWNHVVAISAGSEHTIGLTADGRVIVAGDNTMGQHDLYWTWREGVVAISAGDYFNMVLTSDGRVWSSGGQADPAYELYMEGESPNHHGLSFNENWGWTPEWADIVAISAGGWTVVGLRADGTLVAAGESCNGQLDVYDMEDVVDIVATGGTTYALMKDGTVGQSWYRNLNLDWSGVIHIAGSDSQLIGVMEDGTLKTRMEYYDFYSNDYEPYDVNDWSNIGLPADAKVFDF